MELAALLIAVVFYQWIIIPITKKKVGYMRDHTANPIFYDYKTKWQMFFELGISVLMIVLAVVFTPLLGIFSAFFIPVGLIAIFIVRGKLEYKVMADFKHHVISYLHAFSIFFVFASVVLYVTLVD
jgi:hypothetical protein